MLLPSRSILGRTNAISLVGTVLVDMIFCVLPWQFIWKIHRPRREKILIAGSLSLGILYVHFRFGVRVNASATGW